LVNEVISTVQPQATQKGNALTVSCDPHLGTMRSDAVKVRQVLINLLSNANKFTERGSIHIAAQRTRVGPADWVEFTVRDSGIGIAPQKLEKLFTEFYQADPSATRKYGGSGLGLAISRRFCQMMGGDITVDSRVDVGSTFRALLPVEVKEPVQPKERSAPPDVATADEPESRVAVDPRVVRLAANPRKGNVEHNRRKRVPRVLVIDDDPGARDLLIRFLNRQGCVVEVARSGDEGLEMARKLRPDLITLDVVMPGLNGWEVLQELKKDVDIAHIPVIMLTMTDEKLLGYSLGAAHFLSKPLDRGMFMEVLTRLLRQSPRS
jgi:CheY-like chemotaxis protein